MRTFARDGMRFKVETAPPLPPKEYAARIRFKNRWGWYLERQEDQWEGPFYFAENPIVEVGNAMCRFAALSAHLAVNFVTLMGAHVMGLDIDKVWASSQQEKQAAAAAAAAAAARRRAREARLPPPDAFLTQEGRASRHRGGRGGIVGWFDDWGPMIKVREEVEAAVTRVTAGTGSGTRERSREGADGRAGGLRLRGGSGEGVCVLPSAAMEGRWPFSLKDDREPAAFRKGAREAVARLHDALALADEPLRSVHDPEHTPDDRPLWSADTAGWMEELVATYQTMPWFRDFVAAVRGHEERRCMEEPWLQWLMVGPAGDTVCFLPRARSIQMSLCHREEDGDPSRARPPGEGAKIPWTRMREVGAGCQEVVAEEGVFAVACLDRDLISEFDDVITEDGYAELKRLLADAMQGSAAAAERGRALVLQFQRAYEARGEGRDALGLQDVLEHFERCGGGEGGGSERCVAEEDEQEGGNGQARDDLEMWGVGGRAEEMSRDEYALRHLLQGAGGAEPVEDTLERLSSLTPDEFYRGPGGLVALFQAALSGTWRQVADTLTQAAAVDRAQEFVTRADGLGRTALHYAAREAVSNASSARVLVDYACSLSS